MKPYFSIIIPSLNEEIALPHLLQNLEDQTFKKFEVIHVDGQSEDNTCQFAKKFKKLPAYTLIISGVRHVSHQRNLGAKVSKGEYLLFIDADTGLPPHFLEDLAEKLKFTNPDTFTTYSHPDKQDLQSKLFIAVVNSLLSFLNFLGNPFAIGVLIGTTKTAFIKLQGFREDVNFGEDADFIKLAHREGLSFKVYRHPRFIYSLRRFRAHGFVAPLSHIIFRRLNLPKDYLMGGHLFRHNHEH